MHGGMCIATAYLQGGMTQTPYVCAAQAALKLIIVPKNIQHAQI